MPSWDELLGRGSIVETIAVWGILNQLIQSLLGPFFEEITEKVNDRNPVFPITPPDLADAFVRGVMGEDAATAEARLSGVDAARFRTLIHLAGEPPGLETVLQMYRRQIIGWDDTGPDAASVERAIKTSRVYNYWSDAIKANAQVPLSPGEAVNAALRHQADPAAMESEAYANGITPERFRILLDSAGRPPSPTELMVLVNRGIIPKTGTGPGVLSFDQGISEGDSKNKWTDPLFALREYRPPPRSIPALLKTGSITDTEATAYLLDAGLAPKLAAAYVHNARGEKLAGTKQLAEGTVVTLYESHAIDAADAGRMLGALGYDDAEVGFILETADLQREVRALNSAITRLGTLYTSHKITRTGATEGLAALGLGQSHIDHLLGEWDVTAAANVRQLTPAEIVDAWQLNLIDGNEAIAELVAIGYTPRDAWIKLSIKAKQAQPNEPAQGPAGPGVLP